MTIDVVIRARNASAELRTCLPVLMGQRLPEGCWLDVIVVDNESTDDTRRVALAHQARVVPIAAADFSWGRAVNLGITAADTDVAVILSADATPCDVGWAEAMTRPFADPRVAAVYGRQCPRPNAPVDEAVRLRRAFDDAPRELTADQVNADLTQKRWVCSNACAAVRVSAWREHPFDESAPAAEELPWVRSVLAAGYRVVYEPRARVFHSHREAVARLALREWEIHQNSGRSAARLMGALVKRRLRNCAEPSAGGRAAIEGMMRLPFECAAVGAVALSSLHPALYRAIRHRAWGKN